MRKALKITLYIICSLFFLVLCVVVYLNTPGGQNFVRARAEAYLKNKLKTTVSIGHLGYGLPKYIVLNDVLLLDQANDTLLAAGELKIDINMLQLIHKEVSVQQIVIKGVHSHIYRNLPDTAFNFTYIINAFAGNKPSGPNNIKDTSAPLKMDIDRITFDDIHFHFDDHTGGALLSLNLDHLDLKLKKLDLNKMFFHIKDLDVSGLQCMFAQDTSNLPPGPKDTSKTKLTLIADNVSVRHILFQYNDALNKFLLGLNLGMLELQLNKFGLEDDLVDLKKLAISNADINLVIGKGTIPPAPVDTVIKIDTTEGWHVKAADIELAGINYKMDDENEKHQSGGIDYAHLNVTNLEASLKNLFYNSDNISGNLKHLAAREQSGVYIQELKTVFQYNRHGAILNGLYLKTPNTLLQDHLEAHYTSVADLTKDLQSLQLNINIDRSVIGIKDILIFAPQLETQDVFRKNKNGSVKLDASVSGFLNDLDISNFVVAGLSNTVIVLSGTIKGLPDTNKLSYNLAISKFVSSRTDVNQIVPDSVLSSIRLPDNFGITGQISGTMKDYDAELYLASTDGNAYVRGSVATSPGKNHEKYDLYVKTSELNLGSILKEDSLVGKVTATIAAKGESFDLKTVSTIFDGVIPSAEVKGYRYHDIKLSGKFADQNGNLDFLSVDSNFQMQLTGQADFRGKYPAVKADIRMDSINFQALKFYSSELRARGLIHLDFPELNPDYPRGTFAWWKPVINANFRRYYLDSMFIVSRPSADTGQNIVANLDVVQGTITGKTPLTKIIPIIEEHINRHYRFQTTDSAKKSFAAKKTASDTTTLPADYWLKIQAHVIDKPMLHGLLPGLSSFDSIHVDGSLSPDYLTFNLNAPNIVYGSSSVENANVAVRGADSAFTYKVTVDKITQSNLELWYAEIHGNLDKDNITANVSLADVNKKERFALSAAMQNVGDSQVIQLLPGLKLDYKTWTVAQPNRTVIAKNGFYVQNFLISDSNQSIKANSDEARINAPLKVDFSYFLLSDITDVISHKDTLLADGELNGNITMQQMTPELQLTSDLQIQHLSILGDTFGDLHALVNNKQANTLDAQVTLKGQGNDIALSGNWYLEQNNGNDFNFNLDVNALALHSFQSLALNNIRNSSGFVRGKLQIHGTTSEPVVTGELRTDNLKTTVSQLNAEFKMPAEKIEFSKNQVSFNNFTIQDSANNKAVLSGSLNTADLSDIQMDMKVTARNWRALNATKKDNSAFYGKLVLSADLGIKGSVMSPSMDGDIRVLKGTDMTVVNPETGPEMQDTKGIVIFRNMRDTGRGNYLVPKKKNVVRRKTKVGSDFNVNVIVDKDAQFSLIIDEAQGDFLSVKGDATINASVTPGGTMSLSGSYELHGGSYQLNYNFIKRKFNIKDGSTITFAGDPVTGTNLDVTAVYEVQAPPYDLVAQELSGDASLNYFKQNLPFQVDLHMQGQVLSPHFTFDVELPENKVYPLSADKIDVIQGKLNQVRTDTSELNKQVFALLILSRFVSEDPFKSGAGNSTTSMAMQSVSTFIGEQLNQAAGKLIKGVDFSVDLASTEDYTSGNMQQRTDLNLAASKQLLNNRLKLTVGNDFELQGPQTSNNPSSVVPTNLAADYLLTNDGRYTMRAYRRVYDEGVLEGFVTETGLNFIVNLNFNRFRDVFKKKKPDVTDTTKHGKTN